MPDNLSTHDSDGLTLGYCFYAFAITLPGLPASGLTAEATLENAMPSLSMDEILSNLESYSEQAARLAGPGRPYYALLQDTLQQVTAHLAPLEKSLVMRAAVQTLGHAAEIAPPPDTTAPGKNDPWAHSLLHSEDHLIPFKLG
jgi:hypothetical protein